MKSKVLAHRGASAYAPENTMPAFELAHSMGADGIELDVHLTKDGKVVVIHDDTINRTSGSNGLVSEFTYEELLTFDFSNGKEGFSNVKIPLLEEVYEFTSKNNMFVNVEVKDSTFTNKFVIIDELLQLEKKYEMSENVAYSSFNHYILRDMKNISEKIPTGILYHCGLVNVWDYAISIKANAIHPFFGCLKDKAIIPECAKCNIVVRPWTVDNEDEMASLFKAGIESLITNKPDVGLAVRNKNI